MSLKVKFALLFTVLVSALLAVCFITIYLLYADFRKDEFYQRLRDKCNTTYRLLIEVEEIDHDLLQVIDRNTINALYDEKVLIFDDHNRIIYSSIDDTRITYSPSLLQKVRDEREIVRKERDNEIFGLVINDRGKEYVALISAYDKYGWRKLENLRNILVITFLSAFLLTWVLSFVYVRGFVRPLEVFSARVRLINEKNLKERLQIENQNDEIAALAANFNQMLDRIDNAFAVQKSFVQHASHELRTPLASMIIQTESALARPLSAEEYRNMLKSLLDDQHELADLVNSLLLLSKYEQLEYKEEWREVRVDETMYRSIEMVQALYPTSMIRVDFKHIPDDGSELCIPGNEVLLQSAFRNMIKNACHYSEDNQVAIVMDFTPDEVILDFINNGPVLMPEEQVKIFTPFFRGANASQKKGFGLGLSICRRIITIHHGTIEYTSTGNSKNNFRVILPKRITRNR